MSHPPHWPQHVEYLTSLRFHSSVDIDSMSLIKGQRSTHSTNHSSRSLVAIRRVSSPSDHPALGQFGLYAAKKIPPKTHILDYLGEVHCDERPTSDYDLLLYRSTDGMVIVGIDAAMMGNEGRFVNDFRGIRKRPNSVFEERRSDTGELMMSIWSSEHIKKGDEIVVSYGKSWWRSRTSL